MATEVSDSARVWLLPLLRLVSPTLPIGAYAYSRGLEQAVHAGSVHDEASAQRWIVGLVQHSAARLEAPLFVRIFHALEAGDVAGVEHWNRRLYASRESAELRLEDSQLGAALARLLVGQGVVRAQAWLGRADACYATLFALGAVGWSVPLMAALEAYLWALCESQVSAAVRLIPLGQTAGQRILSVLIGVLPGCAELALQVPDQAIGALAPGFAIASALHETQYTRLFRS